MPQQAKVSNKPVHRYTSLASALHVLSSNSLTLLPTASWEDGNDREYMRIYSERAEVKCVLALCLTSASETNHHWSVFASGSDGVRLVMDRSKLQEAVSSDSSVEFLPVRYETLQRLRKKRPEVSELPFLKRYPYRGEEEHRLLSRSKEDIDSYQLTLPPGTVKEVVLSPRLHPDLVEVTKTAIKNASKIAENGECESVPKVYRSTLLSNDEWVELARN